jgi:RNA polymerase-binding transcription factor DksA
MTAKEKKDFRKQLMDLGKRLRGEVANLENAALRTAGGEASGGLSNAPLHPADLGSDTFEQEVSLSLLQNENQQLGEIVAALRRLDDGTFGRCEECEQPISMERLQAAPYARLCIECARNAEQVVTPGNL